MARYFKPNNATLLYLNSSYNCNKSNSITLTKTSAGSGYISAPTIVITPQNGDSGSGAAATCSITANAIDTITINNNGSGYNVLPIITLTGGGSPGVITGYSGLVGGTGYALPPSISISGGGGGSGFVGSTTLTPTTVSTTVNIVSGGTGYVVGNVLVFNNTGTGGGSGVVGTVATVSAGVITGITISNQGSGYTLKAPTLTSITSTAGTGANITFNLTATSVGSIIITNGGSNFSSAPTFVFTPVSGGTGASATPTINLGTSAVITPSFLRTYSYTWTVPDIVINDLAKLSATNIIATGYSTTTPYTYRISGLQYDSRNSYFSDYGQPILSMAQNTNICNYGSLGGGTFCIILTSQTIKQITILVDDDITNGGSGQSSSINFVIAIDIEEYNPVYEETTDPYNQARSNIKTLF